jgi:two-component system OmpR family sensor kinase
VRLQTRLSIATASIISLVSVAIGGFAVSTSFDNDVARVDDALSVAARQVGHSSGDAVGSALLAGEQSAIGLTVDFLSLNGDLLALSPGSVELTETPSVATLKSAQQHAVTIGAGGPGGSGGSATAGGTDPTGKPATYRLRTVALPDNEYVILAASLTAQIESRDANIRLLIWFILASVIFGAVAIVLFIRRDVLKISRLVDAAGQIAKGDAEVALPAGNGESEVDRLARALRNMVDSLQHSIEVERTTQQNMQTFLGDASHELRTPLTVIKGYVELLQKNPEAGAEQTTRAYERMLSEANRMDALIRDLLLLAELGETKTETKIMSELSVIDLSAVVSTAVDDLRILQPTRPVVVSIEPGIDVLGARDLLLQVLANLTSNIRRHTLVTDSLRVSLHTEDGMLAVLSFDDSGRGLPEEFYAGGINHFQRFDNSRSRESGGSGLGMSILAAIVRKHGGEVKLEQSDLGGLRTEIRLPLAR